MKPLSAPPTRLGLRSSPAPENPERSSPAPEKPERALPGTLVVGMSAMLSSQALLALGGIACLPLLTRNLGRAHYGRFSLQVTLLGTLIMLDFARPVLVRHLSAGEKRSATLSGLVDVNTAWLVVVAAVLGFVVLSPVAASALVIAVALHARTSLPFSRLAAAGRVHTATVVRNVCWLAAIVTITALSFGSVSPHTYAWPFAGACAVILWVLTRLAAGTEPIPRANQAHRRAALSVHRGEIRDLIGFSVAAGTLASAERLSLEHSVEASVSSSYMAQSDLALKLNAALTALGVLLYPMFSRELANGERADVSRRFVRIASWITLGWYGLVLSLVLLDKQVVSLVLGPEYTDQHAVYLVCLLCIFVQLWGFLITPWQRARGEFGVQRRAYSITAVVMLTACLTLVPPFGVTGALIAYGLSRFAEAGLFLYELRQLPAGSVGKARLITLAAMFLSLVGLVVWKLGGGRGLTAREAEHVWNQRMDRCAGAARKRGHGRSHEPRPRAPWARLGRSRRPRLLCGGHATPRDRRYRQRPTANAVGGQQLNAGLQRRAL